MFTRVLYTHRTRRESPPAAAPVIHEYTPSTNDDFSEEGTVSNTSPQLLDKSLGIVYPWYTFPFLKELSSWDVSSWRVFEYGGGGSTEWWRRKAREVVTVDNDPVWATKHNLLLETTHDAYIKKPLEVGGLFDCIIIDGLPTTWRDDCTETALKCLKPGGILIMDNYHQASCDVGLTTWPKTDALLQQYGMEVHAFKQKYHADWKTAYTTFAECRGSRGNSV